jgi:SulP family sulfate permease
VFADLVIAVNVGVVLASLLFMRRMAQSVEVVAETDNGEDGPRNSQGDSQPALPPGTLVYRVDGPYFFGAAEKLEHTLDNIQAHMARVVLRLDRVPFIDATGMQSLAEMADDFRRRGTRLALCGARPNVVAKLRRAGVLARIGEDSLFPTLDDFARQCAISTAGATAADVSEPAAGR